MVCCGLQLWMVFVCFRSKIPHAGTENCSGGQPDKTETTLPPTHPSLPRPFRAPEAVSGNVSSPMRNTLAEPSRCCFFRATVSRPDQEKTHTETDADIGAEHATVNLPALSVISTGSCRCRWQMQVSFMPECGATNRLCIIRHTSCTCNFLLRGTAD